MVRPVTVAVVLVDVLSLKVANPEEAEVEYCTT